MHEVLAHARAQPQQVAHARAHVRRARAVFKAVGDQLAQLFERLQRAVGFECFVELSKPAIAGWSCQGSANSPAAST